MAASGAPSDRPAAPYPAPDGFDLQGHRGARGLLPENTIPAFLEAVRLGVTTVELDTVVTGDGRIVVSHDPWFDPWICTRPDGRRVRPADRDRFLIYRMAYDEVAAFDCGRRRHPRFRRQRPVPAAKPLLHDAVVAVETFARELGRAPVRFNIETKSRPEWDGRIQAPPEEFVRLLYTELASLGVLRRTLIQSFDVRTLQLFRRLDPAVRLSLLVDDRAGFDGHLERLGFVPDVYSPDHRLVDRHVIAEAHRRGLRVVPWTVHRRGTMRRLIRLGVDGLITDYPDIGRAVGDAILPPAVPGPGP